MLIESILRRPNGTEVTFGRGAEAATYRFFGKEGEAHLCEVENPDHIEKFLAIPEGYRIAREDRSATDLAAEKAEAILLAKKEAAEREEAARALAVQEAEAARLAGWEAEREQREFDAKRAAFEETVTLGSALPIPSAAEPVEGDPVPVGTTTIEDARAAFKARFGRAPHKNMSLENIEAKLSDEVEAV